MADQDLEEIGTRLAKAHMDSHESLLKEIYTWLNKAARCHHKQPVERANCLACIYRRKIKEAIDG